MVSIRVVSCAVSLSFLIHRRHASSFRENVIQRLSVSQTFSFLSFRNNTLQVCLCLLLHPVDYPQYRRSNSHHLQLSRDGTATPKSPSISMHLMDNGLGHLSTKDTISCEPGGNGTLMNPIMKRMQETVCTDMATFRHVANNILEPNSGIQTMVAFG